MPKHTPATPLPWHMGVKQAERIVYDASGWAVANATTYHGQADKEETKANAAYIAHAANAYPKLVDALRLASLWVDAEAAKEQREDFAAILSELGESS